MISAVLFVNNTTVNNITLFHDQISNEIPDFLGPWSFDLKIYRTNPVVTKLYQIASPNSKPVNQSMYTLSLSYNKFETVSVIGDTSLMFKGVPSEQLVKNGGSTGFCDPFDAILQSKMTSTWKIQQYIKGEGGSAYQIHDGDETFIIRTSNCFLHGGFKGFLVEVTYEADWETEEQREEGVKKIEQLALKLKFPSGKLSTKRLNNDRSFYGDLVAQYTDALQI